MAEIKISSGSVTSVVPVAKPKFSLTESDIASLTIGSESNIKPTTADRGIDRRPTQEPADKAGGHVVSNANFMAAIFENMPVAASAVVCSKGGDPGVGGWIPIQAARLDQQCPPSANNYFNCSSFTPEVDGSFKARKDNAAAFHCLVLDDVGTKVPRERLGDFEPSWEIETSPGNYQVGVILVQPLTDVSEVVQLQSAVIAAGLCDPGASGMTRWVRLPVGINGKPQHRSDSGQPFPCRLVRWRSDLRYSSDQIVSGLKLILAAVASPDQQSPREAAAFVPESSIDDCAAIDQLTPLLKVIDPDCSYSDWLHVLMAVYHETGGSADGLALVNSWSSAGDKYKGIAEIEAKWRSFRGDIPNPVTIGTLIKMVNDAEAFEPCETEVIEPAPPVAVKPLDPLAAMQDQFGMINMSGKICVFDRTRLDARTDQGAAERLMLSSRTDGALLISRALAADFPLLDPKPILSTFWISPQTIFYAGVDFRPDGTAADYLNLWVGPTVVPKAGSWKLIRNFFLEVLCADNEGNCQYLLQYSAHALQHPGEKPGVMIALLGGQGIGKGTLGRVFQKIWGATYLQVNNIDSVTGNFNAALERCFVVFMDEALFHGDHRASDALKSLVTEPVIHINEKHQPSRQIHSYHRFVVATNASHLKSTDRDDRRDFVLRVSEARKGDRAYWQALYEEIENGGVAAMVHDLLAMDLSGFNVRDKPSTGELLEQKLQSLDPIARWWFDCLCEGEMDADGSWPDFVATQTVIKGVWEMAGGKLFRKPAPIDVVRALTTLCPSVSKDQRTDTLGRRRGLNIPSLEQARAEFDQYIGAKVQW